MKISKISIENFRGIKNRSEITANNFNCIVGKNDVGKSTILKALDLFLNDKSPSSDDKNAYNESSKIIIELSFNINVTTPITITDEVIPTTLIDEELLDENNMFTIKKEWDVSGNRSKLEWYIRRKSYGDEDFLFMKEPELMKSCNKLGIETVKGNNEEYNNVEKRRKLREYHYRNASEFYFEYTLLASTSSSGQRYVLDVIKSILPTFEYFKADTSLSESENSIQKYFREKALNTLRNSGVDTNELEENIRNKIDESLSRITTLINSIVPDEEHITANVEFDWSKLISTSFRSKKDTANIPLASRGDGFRRIAMMAYFEMLAEENKGDKDIIFGFEEPETFLHPQIQRQLLEKLLRMTEVGYQVFTTTHSPTIVAGSNTNSIIFIQKNQGVYIAVQGELIELKTIVEELGIKGSDEIIKIHDNIKLLLLVEGKDDVIAYSHIAEVYKSQGVINNNFLDLGVHLLPIGGCGSIQNWINLNVIKNLNKPFYILLDSDKEEPGSISNTRLTLIALKFQENIDFHVTRKREMENYIPPSYFLRLSPPIEIEYNDWSDVKKISKSHAESGRLGGRGILSKHFKFLTYEELKSSFDPNNENDEFLDFYKKIYDKINAISN